MKATPAFYRGPEYYDGVYVKSKMYADTPIKSLRFDRVIERMTGKSFIDIGCGTGQFGAYAMCHGKTYVLGVDFSPVAISKAVERTGMAHICGDVMGDVVQMAIQQLKYDHIILMEILEHIHDDVGLLRSIPLGKDIILTVPTYSSIGHVRYFDNLDDVVQRYGGIVRPDHTGIIQYSEGPNKWLLLQGVRGND